MKPKFYFAENRAVVKAFYAVLIIAITSCGGPSEKQVASSLGNTEAAQKPAFEEREEYEDRYVISRNGVYLFPNHSAEDPASHLPYGTKVSVRRAWTETKNDSAHFFFVEFENHVKGWVRSDAVDAESPGPGTPAPVTPGPSYFYGSWLHPVWDSQTHSNKYQYAVFDEDSTFKVYFLGHPKPSRFGKWMFAENGMSLNEGFNINDYTLAAPRPIYEVVEGRFAFRGAYDLLNFMKVDDMFWGGKTRFTTRVVEMTDRMGQGGTVLRRLQSGAAVNYFSSKDGWAKVAYKSDTGFVEAAVLVLEIDESLRYVDVDLFEGQWTTDGGEALVLEAGNHWYWEGPDAEDLNGKWKYDHANKDLVVESGQDGATTSHKVYLLTYDRMILDWNGSKVVFLRIS